MNLKWIRVVVAFGIFAGSAMAQTFGGAANGAETTAAKKNPSRKVDRNILGVQTVKPERKAVVGGKTNRNDLGVVTKKPEKTSDNPSQGPRLVSATKEQPSEGTRELVVQHAVSARGNAWISDQVRDSAAQGTLTMFNVSGPQATFDVTLLRKGDRQIQRIFRQNGREVRQGSDGTRSWSVVEGMTSMTEAPEPVLRFIESLTNRSFQTLLKTSKKDAASSGVDVLDLGMKGRDRAIEVRESQANTNDIRKTRYYIEPATSSVSRIEMVTGEAFVPFLNRNMETTESIVFSDYRDVGGVMTPFKMERYSNEVKVEEMQFKTVAHNQSISDREFVPSSKAARN